MKAYSYNQDTGEYLGEVEAHLDILETELKSEYVYALPACSTFTAPPELQTGYVRCWLNGGWEQVEDHRGETVYSKVDASTKTITELGAVPEGYTELIPTTDQEWDEDTQKWKNIVISYEAKKVLKHQQIDALKKVKELNGVPYVFPGNISGTIQTRDADDFRNIDGTASAGLILSGQNVTLPFRDQENRNYELTPAEGVALGIAVYTRIGNIAKAAWAHKDALTEENIDTYDITTGWPE